MRRARAGKVTVPMLLLAAGLAGSSYACLRYLPVWFDFLRLRALVAEAGQRAASFEEESQSRSWFEARAAEEGFSWMPAEALYWRRVDRQHLDVGLRYEVTVPHPPLGAHTLVLSWYCTASEGGCVPFRPQWEPAP